MLSLGFSVTNVYLTSIFSFEFEILYARGKDGQCCDLFRPN